jgi:hypothetical protein
MLFLKPKMRDCREFQSQELDLVLLPYSNNLVKPVFPISSKELLFKSSLSKSSLKSEILVKNQQSKISIFLHFPPFLFNQTKGKPEKKKKKKKNRIRKYGHANTHTNYKHECIYCIRNKKKKTLDKP